MNKVFNLTNKYIVLATPLILYSLISSIYLLVSANGGKILNLLFAIILFILMTGAFISGWFYMIKIAIIEKTPTEDPNSLIKEFPAGVGEYFLPCIGAILIAFSIFSISLVASYFIGINFIGNPEISTEALSKALQNSAALKDFMTGLSVEQLTKINLWNLLILGFSTLTYFLMFLFLPAIFFKNKNPFFAFFVSLKDLFSKHILKTIGVFLSVFTINFIISMLSTIFSNNAFLHFIITLLNFYFITFVSTGLFYYYYKTFIATSIGQKVNIEI